MGPHGETIYPEGPTELAAELAAFVRDFGVNAVGGCCGTTPAHVAALRDAVAAVERKQRRRPHRRRKRPPRRSPPSRWSKSRVRSSSANASTRKARAKIKRLLLDDDYDDIVLVAREQVEGGAHVLDVCCALTERADEDEQMRDVVRRLAQSIEAPLMIDTTEPRVMEAALTELCRPRDPQLGTPWSRAARKIDAVLPLAREHGAAVDRADHRRNRNGKDARRASSKSRAASTRSR